MFDSEMQVNKKALYEIVADKLEDMILSDGTQIDKCLPSEQVLSASFGVSRPVIREALKILRERGLVTLNQGNSTVISQPGTEQLFNSLNRIVQLKNVDAIQIFQLRLALETTAAFLVAEKATESDIEKLNKMNDDMYNSSNAKEQTKLDFLFHKEIAKISGNELLVLFLEALGNLIETMVHTSLLSIQKEDGYLYHRKLIKAFTFHNAVKAETIIREHLTLSMRNYEVAVSENKSN